MSTAPGRIFATLTSMLHTRLDLMSVELEEDLLRFSSYAIYAIIALFCGGIALCSFLVLILMSFWEGHRIAVLTGFTVVFGASSVFVFLWLKNKCLNKPPLLEQTIAEFKKDVSMFTAQEQEFDAEQQGLS